MPGNAYDHEQLDAALKDGTLDIKAVRRSAGRVLHLILTSLDALDKETMDP